MLEEVLLQSPPSKPEFIPNTHILANSSLDDLDSSDKPSKFSTYIDPKENMAEEARELRLLNPDSDSSGRFST